MKDRIALLLLVLFGACCLIVLRASALSGLSWYAPWVYTIWGLVVVLCRPKWDSLVSLLCIATVFRLCCIGAPLIWSDDLYRYLWEGKLVLQGGNPFVEPPASFDVLDGIRERVNHPHIPTVYPPLAQVFFALCSVIWYHPAMIQTVFALVDGLTLWGLWTWSNRNDHSLENVQWLWVYALHPLAIVESAWSGHLESLVMCCVVWGMVNCERGGRWFWLLGGWVKLLPFVFLGFVRDWSWRQVLGIFTVSILATLYFWDMRALNGLSTYAKHWEYNSSMYALLSLISPLWARPLCGAIMVCTISLIWWQWKHRRLSVVRSLASVCAVVVLCSPTVHPWYGLWILVPPILVGDRRLMMAAALWCALVPLTYVSLFTLDPVANTWDPPLWPTLVTYGIPFVYWSVSLWKR